MGWYPHRTPIWLTRLFPYSLFTGGVGDGKTIYLTFDDGPDPEATPWVLQQLDHVGAKATFFLVGDKMAQHPEVVEQVIAQGHVIGNHTYHHLSGWRSSLPNYRADIDACQELISQYPATSSRPLFRPPYGRITPKQAKELSKDYQVVMWSLLAGDFDKRMTPSRSLTKLSGARGGDVVVFHDSAKFLPLVRQVLPGFLTRFHDKGFKFAGIA